MTDQQKTDELQDCTPPASEPPTGEQQASYPLSPAGIPIWQLQAIQNSIVGAALTRRALGRRHFPIVPPDPQLAAIMLEALRPIVAPGNRRVQRKSVSWLCRRLQSIVDESQQPPGSAATSEQPGSTSEAAT